MATEALLRTNPNLVQKPEHDLESILNIILYMCTFFQGPGVPLDSPHLSPPMCSWFNNNDSKEIGYLKLSHLECYDTAILPNFAPYWHDLAPFVEELIIACFPVEACLPNNLRYEQVLGILRKAYDAVEEPSHQIHQAIEAQCLKRSSSTLLYRNSKKGRRILS